MELSWNQLGAISTLSLGRWTTGENFIFHLFYKIIATQRYPHTYSSNCVPVAEPTTVSVQPSSSTWTWGNEPVSDVISYVIDRGCGNKASSSCDGDVRI